MKLILLLIVLLFTIASSDTCGGNCPSGKCPTCYCGANKSMQDIAYWCNQYSWDKKCCQCIVSHESGGNAHAINYNTNGSTDVGLWQINNINWGQCSDGKAPCDPKVNLNCAIDMYKWGGNTFKLWDSHTACGCWLLFDCICQNLLKQLLKEVWMTNKYPNFRYYFKINFILSQQTV